jgi:hypothetical protein
VGGVAVGHVHPLKLRVSLSKTGLVHSWVLRDWLGPPICICRTAPPSPFPTPHDFTVSF